MNIPNSAIGVMSVGIYFEIFSFQYLNIFLDFKIRPTSFIWNFGGSALTYGYACYGQMDTHNGMVAYGRMETHGLWIRTAYGYARPMDTHGLWIRTAYGYARPCASTVSLLIPMVKWMRMVAGIRMDTNDHMDTHDRMVAYGRMDTRDRRPGFHGYHG